MSAQEKIRDNMSFTPQSSYSYEEIIEVSLDPQDNPEGAIPTPEMNYIKVLKTN